MDGINVQFGDLDRLAFDLAAAPALAREQAGKALSKAGNDIIMIAGQLVPIDTGATKASIGMDTPQPLERVIGPTTEYAPYLELGTATQPPRAFMGPAADRVAPELTDALSALGAEVMRP